MVNSSGQPVFPVFLFHYRFCYEMSEGMNPAGCSILTDKNPTRKIPAGYYDTEDGFYDPVRNVVVDANDLREVLR